MSDQEAGMAEQEPIVHTISRPALPPPEYFDNLAQRKAAARQAQQKADNHTITAVLTSKPTARPSTTHSLRSNTTSKDKK